MDITASMVRELREKSGAGMMDCKKALSETGGDMEQAFDFLRKQGLKSADKKASREMGEGRVHSVSTGNSGAMVAITCETDFAAKTPDFESFMDDLVAHVQANKSADAEAVLAETWSKTGETADAALKSVIAKIGENLSIARVVAYENTSGVVGAYIHHNNKVGVLVSVTTTSTDTASALKDLCLHIAAMKPEYLSRDEISEEVIAREKDVFMAEVAGKPENIQEKILGGKLEKFFAGCVLPSQAWVKDDKLTVQKALEAQLGAGTRIEAFSRFEIGS